MAVPDPWGTPIQPISSPLFATPATGAPGGMDFNAFLNTLKGKGKDIAQQTGRRAGEMRAAYSRQPGRYSAIAGTALAAVPQITQGNVLGAVTSTVGGLVGGGLGSLAANLAPGPLKPIARAVFPLAGGLLGGTAAEQAVTAGQQKVEQANQSPGGPDVEIAGVPLTPAAQVRRQREQDRAQSIADIQQIGGAQLGIDRQAIQDQVNAYVQLQKSLQPLAERTMRQQLINQQALINTQTSAYQTLGRQAGMFKLAGQGMSEAGATLRTAISQNPYAGATLQAPSISFG